MVPEQCRAARALLDWSTSKLGEASNIDPAVIEQFERGLENPAQPDIAILTRALEQAGVIFIPADANGPGVRLQHALAKDDGLRLSELNAANDG